MKANYQRMLLCFIITSTMSTLLEGCGAQHEATDLLRVNAGSTTMGNGIDDSIITTKIRSALLADVNVKHFDIGVITRKGEIQLSGVVDNQSEIDRAIEIAHRIDGVRSVGNDMNVKK